MLFVQPRTGSLRSQGIDRHRGGIRSLDKLLVALAPTAVGSPISVNESVCCGFAALVALATDGQTNRHSVHLSNA